MGKGMCLDKWLMEYNVGNKYFGMRTERWPTYRAGDGEPIAEYLRRVRTELSTLEMAARIQWTGRRIWSSHTYPGGCWICDLAGLCHGLLELLEDAYPSEAPDREDSETINMAESSDIDKEPYTPEKKE